MSGNGLRQVNGERSFCEYDHSALNELIETSKSNAQAIDRLTTSIQTLTTYHREMTRWLLIVVCVIALGSKMVEMAKDIWGAKIAHAEAK